MHRHLSNDHKQGGQAGQRVQLIAGTGQQARALVSRSCSKRARKCWMAVLARRSNAGDPKKRLNV